MARTCIIGLDGGTFKVIDYLAAQGRLPNFSRLMANGSRAVLMSTVPPITPAAWSSFYMGTNPGKHGSVGFFRFRSGSYRLEPMNANTVRGTALWSLAGSEGKRVCVYDVPVTYPAAPVNGIMISGMDAPHFNDRSVFPAGLRREILDTVPGFDISSSVDYRYLARHHPDPEGECIRQLQAHQEIEIGTVNHLMHKEQWDLLVAIFRSTDSFQHIFWDSAARMMAGSPREGDERRAEAVFGAYERIDKELGGSWKQWLESRNLVVMSDHGFGGLKSEICLNRFLAEAGLLAFMPGSARSTPKKLLADQFRDHLPRNLRKRLKKALGRDDSERRWQIFVDSLVADIDFSRTRIFSIAQFGCFYVNMKGRRPLGIVAGETERRTVIAEAREALAGLVDPEDGEPVATRFYDRDELYHGSLLEEMPDLVVELRDYAYQGIYNTSDELAQEKIICGPPQRFGRLSYTGTHRSEGILILSGPGVRPTKLPAASIIDIAPTVARMMGLPEVPEWDGRALEEALIGGEGKPGAQPGKTRAFPAGKESARGGQQPRGAGYSEEDEEAVRQRLQDLGYI